MSDQLPPEEPSGSLPPPPEEGAGAPAPPQPAITDAMRPVAPAEGGAVTSKPRSKKVTVALLAGAAVLVLGVVGAAAAYFMLRGSPEVVLDKVPSGADAVVVAHLDPAASQKVNLFRMASKFPDLGTQQDLTQKVNGMLDQALSGSGLTRDDLGWVGGEAGAYVTINGAAPEYAVLIASNDDDAASAAMQKYRDASGSTYTQTTVDGVTVWAAASDGPEMAIVDGAVVLASDQHAMQSVIQTDQGASSIQDDQTFTTVMDQLPDDNLGFAYVNLQALTSLAGSLPGGIGGLGTTQWDAYQAAAYSISAESNGLAIDGATTTDPSKLTDAQRAELGSGPNALLALTPSNAYAVLAVSGFGKALEDGLTQFAQVGPGPARTIERLGLIGPDGVLQHLTGDVGLQVGPGSGFLPVGGTVMLGVDDAGSVQSWLDTHLPVLLARAGIPGLSARSLKTEDYHGVTITYSAMPTTPIAWGVVNGALVVGLSANAVEQAVDLSQGTGSSITSNADFSSATEGLPGTQLLLYIDVNGILTAVQGILPNDAYQQFLDEGGKNLQPIKAVVGGGANTETVQTYRLFIEIP